VGIDQGLGMLVLFFDSTGMVVELGIAALMFMWWLPRRKAWVLKSALCFSDMLVVTYAWSQWGLQSLWAITAQNILVYALVVAWMLWCWNINLRQALFYVVMSGALQHLVYRGARISSVWLSVSGWVAVHDVDVMYAVLQIPLYIVGYVIFARPLVKQAVMLKGHSIFAMLVGMMLCVSVFTNMFNLSVTPMHDYQAYTVFSLFDFVTCVFMLALGIELVGKQQAMADSAILQQLLRQQKQQLESSKETIDVINVKTHDLKKQISSLGAAISDEQRAELTDLVEIYDSSVRTGNETIDVLLAQKALLCEQRGIQFDRMVDGSLLGFMSPADIYSLLGNALDNALEAIGRMPQNSLRYLTVRIQESKGMAIIRVVNPYAGELKMLDGLPATTKEDVINHGFGMRSIKLIADQYGGYISVATEHNVFKLTVIIPVPQQQSQAR